jgi:dTDP-4-amino-4,6-dideoxygalactose transaminase
MDLKRINNTDELETIVKNTIKSGAFIQGPEKKQFEKDFAEYIGVKHCIGVDSGTSALELSLKAMGIGPGDEVITVPNTFYATAYAIASVGAKPVFVDVDPKTMLIDYSKIPNAITQKTKAILPVHLYGRPVDINKCKIYTGTVDHFEMYNNTIPILEDACQAHGATFEGKKCGSLGDIAAFSFYPGKNLGAFGDGGAVTTNNADLAEKVRLLHEYGSTQKYHHDILGGNHRLDTVQAAVLSHKLKSLNDWNEQRANTAYIYDYEFKNNRNIVIPQPTYGHVYHLYIIQHKDRDKLQVSLKEREIDSGLHYPIPLHLTEAFKYLGYKEGDFPVSEKLAKNILSLPMFPGMTANEVLYVADNVNRLTL